MSCFYRTIYDYEECDESSDGEQTIACLSLHNKIERNATHIAIIIKWIIKKGYNTGLVTRVSPCESVSAQGNDTQCQLCGTEVEGWARNKKGCDNKISN